MYKKIGILALILSLFLAIQCESKAFWFFKKQPKNQVVEIKEPSFVPLNKVNENKIWVGTFQLVWNDLVNEIIKAPVHFTGVESKLADELNKQTFNTTMISDDSYYKKYGMISYKLKKQIERGIYKKFKEKSDILNSVDWNMDGLLIYAMLKKDFEFLNEFEVLKSGDFLGDKVKFFGFEKSAKKELLDNVEIVFYESKDDFAIKLKTKNNEEVFLYRTDDNKTLEEFYSDLNKKYEKYDDRKSLTKNDSIKIPYIKFDEKFNYTELQNKPIEGSDFVIDGAIQTIKFKMDNKGGSLKSEAALIMTMSAMPERDGIDFNFDKPFVMFLKEKGKYNPYFAAHFINSSLFEKE